MGISFVTLYSTQEGYHLYHVRNSYEEFEDDMSTFVQESIYEFCSINAKKLE